MSEQEKKHQRIYDMLYAETKPKKISQILYGLYQAQTVTPLITLYATSHPNIGSLKIAIEEERNKMPEEFIFMACI